MIKRLLSLLLTVFSICSVYADGLPVVSTDGNEVWYLIQFSEGGFVFDGNSNGADLRNESAVGTDQQLWKFSGNEAEGYQITNKKGLSIYVSEASKNGAVKVDNAPAQNTLFSIVESGNPNHKGTYEIVPKGNGNIGLNLAGGVQWRNGKVGMWDKNDINNCVTFVSQKEFESIGKYAIIPYPNHLEEMKEGSLMLNTIKRINCPLEELKVHLLDFQQQLEKVSGIQIELVDGEGTAENAIMLSLNAKLKKEAYTLKVNDNGITIEAAGTAGFFYALQTLKQLLPNAYFGEKRNTEVAWSLPFVAIEDQPQLSHRGFMLDVARHFFTKEEVMRILDVMSLYKMNIFHWHLTEDQGWRIEIPEYPKLTEVGSIRKASYSNPGEGGAFWDDTEYGRGMWYSQKDLKEVVAYAKARNIDIIPEVDFPGHMVAAVTAYPELSCDPSKTYEVRVAAGISEDVLNIGNDKVIDFLKCIMDNLAKIFPYQYIHFGGDECPTKQWETNAECLQRVKDKKLKGVHELQSWLIEELGTYVKEKYNKDIMVWDELTAHWNKNNTIKPIVMCWHNNNNVAADLGLKSVTCPHDYTYLDMMQIEQNKALIDEPYRGGWNDDKVTTVQKTYSLDPNYKTKGREQFVHGVQANMWTETTNDAEELEYQVFPRLIATAEVGWLPVNKKNWGSFYKRLQSHDEILEAMKVYYAKHFIEPEVLSEKESVILEAEYILSASVRGGVGYPDAALYDALQQAVKAAGAAEADLTLLQTAIDNYKKAPIAQPVAGKMYQIVSACTYYKKQFAGSTVYESNNGLRFHYTPQTEPEELWEFVPTEGGFYLQNVGNGLQVAMPQLNKPAILNQKGTPIRVDKATVATRNYSYIPGVVNLSAVKGYHPTVNGKVKRLVAQVSGAIHVADDVALCYPGTWKLVEVTDFSAQLKGLCNKCESMLRKSQPGQVGQPTQAAITFLKEKVLQPAQKALEKPVTEEIYKTYLALYYEFQAMPKTSIMDSLDESAYYFIQNAYFTDYYACATGNKVSVMRLNHENDAFFWQVIKNADGSVAIANKAKNMYTYVEKSAQLSPVLLQAQADKAYWLLENIMTDQGKSGVAITEATQAFSWYAYADGSSTKVEVNLRPKDWGASIWNFIKTDTEITGIEEVTQENKTDLIFYDLSGRKVNHPQKGLFIKSNGEKVFIP